MKITALGSAVLSAAMIAAILLLAGGTRFALRPGERRRGILMIVAGLVLIGNVLIWAWPSD